MAFSSLLLLTSCSRSETKQNGADPSSTATSGSAGHAAAPTESGSMPLVLARGVRIVRAKASADAAEVVREERAQAAKNGRDLVVYVGAKWCEPCRHFHEAAHAGALDGEFPTLTLLEFDLDEDRERLIAAGYASQFIPLFALPGPDGRASDRKFEGAVKGDGAVAHIAPRLRGLLRK